MENDIVVLPKDLLKRRKRNKRQTLPKNIFAGNEDYTPNKIIVYYSDKINIKQIDSAVLFKFKKMKDEIYLLKDDVTSLSEEAKKEKIISEKEDIKKKIFSKKILINDLAGNKSLNIYVDSTKTLLKEYEKNSDIEVAEKYLQIAGKYIAIEKMKKFKHNFNCKGCSYDLEKIAEDKDGFYICPECNALNNSLKPNKYVKDLENLNNSYEEDINNFIKIIDKFEGKNTITIHDELYDELDDYFVSKDMKDGKYYRNLDLNEGGKKEGTSRKKLWLALEFLGYNQYYDETSYIAHIYWGWEIPNLDLYREQILKDYQNTQQIWGQIKMNYKRSASLGTQYRLMGHLKSVGYDRCDREDFKIQDMVESLRLHNHAWKIMCEKCDLAYHEVS